MYYFKVEGGFQNYITKRTFKIADVYQIQTFNTKCYETGVRSNKGKHTTVYSCNFIFADRTTVEFAILVDYAEYKRMEETVKRLMPERRMDLFFIKQHLIDKVKNTSVTGSNSLAGPVQQTGVKKHLPVLSRRESSMLQYAEGDRVSYEVKIKLQN